MTSSLGAYNIVEDDIGNRKSEQMAPICPLQTENRYMMTVSQPSTLLLEESGTFEGATPVQFDVCDFGGYSKKHRSPGEAGDRFDRETKESITWIDGRISVSF
jgi:hypothetical protein